PAVQCASVEVVIVTPAVEISNAWRAAALPVGIGLMILTSFIRFFQVANLRLVGKAMAAVVVIGLAFYVAQPLFAHLGKLNLIIFFVGLVAAMVLAGVPIAFSFGLATFAYIALTTSIPIPVMIGRMDEGMSHL